MQSVCFKGLVASKAKSWKILSLLQLLLAAQKLAWCSHFYSWSPDNYEKKHHQTIS